MFSTCLFICQKQPMTGILGGEVRQQTHISTPPPKLGYCSSKGYQMKLLAICLVHVYMSKTTNDRHFVWWGTQDRHISTPPSKLD